MPWPEHCAYVSSTICFCFSPRIEKFSCVSRVSLQTVSDKALVSSEVQSLFAGARGLILAESGMGDFQTHNDSSLHGSLSTPRVGAWT